MKNWILLIFFSLFSNLSATPLIERTIDPAAISNLASRFGILPDQDLVAETQKKWLRKPGQERWEIEEVSPEQKSFVIRWATEQGLYSDWKSARDAYDKALILGATTSRMQMRLDYLKQLWDEGVRFNEIVWLTGDRPLDARVDELTDQCKTESEAARVLWEEADLPREMKNLSVTFIAVPMKGNTRPTTQDTIIAWLESAPGPCTALFVSDQPFCGYQFAVVNATLPDYVFFDLVGRGVDPLSHPSGAAITLDTIARWIYQERIVSSVTQ